MINNWSSKSTVDLANEWKKDFGFSKKEAWRKARKTRRYLAMLPRSFKAKKYANARILRKINQTPDFLLRFRGQAVFTIKERKYIVSMSDLYREQKLGV